MSAIVCGKRSFFEELQQSPSPTSASPPVAKKLRCSSSTSPLRFSPPSVVLAQLRELFSHMDNQVLEKVLEECGNDLDAAIMMLNELSLVYGEGNSASAVEANAAGATATDGEETAPSEDPSDEKNILANGAEWVELIVREMESASSRDDARSRAARVLDSLEKSIILRAGAEAGQSLQKENMMLKEQLEVALRENAILKRAVAIQHERQKENDDRIQEVEQLKQLLTQYQEQLRTLEMNNYALTVHLRQAQQNNSIPGRFHPDVF